MKAALQGYRRPDGLMGIRNYVIAVATMDIAHPTVRRIAGAVRGAVAICPGFGRALLGEDAAQHFRVLSNMATHPNVYGAVVIGLDKKSSYEVADVLARTGRPVEAYPIGEVGGTLKATEAGIRTVMRLVRDASRLKPEPMSWPEFTLGLECGGSDGSSGMVANPTVGLIADRIIDRGGTVIMSETVEMLGGEHLLAARAVSSQVAADLKTAVDFCVSYAAAHGIDLLGSNPTADNIEGGLSTIEEKALGAIKKAGTKPLQEVIGLGFRPTRKGFVIMDAPAPGVENITSLAAGGCQAIIFTTGQGNPLGHPIAPTLKVCGNPSTVAAMSDNIDVNLSAVITDGQSLEEAAEVLEEELVAVINGKQVSADLLGETEVAISRILRCL
jgi:altronate dehydratase large subunit